MDAALGDRECFLDKDGDLDLASSMVFEGTPPRRPFGQGIRDFVDKDTRDARRDLVRDFWFD